MPDLTLDKPSRLSIRVDIWTLQSISTPNVVNWVMKKDLEIFQFLFLLMIMMMMIMKMIMIIIMIMQDFDTCCSFPPPRSGFLLSQTLHILKIR